MPAAAEGILRKIEPNFPVTCDACHAEIKPGVARIWNGRKKPNAKNFCLKWDCLPADVREDEMDRWLVRALGPKPSKSAPTPAPTPAAQPPTPAPPVQAPPVPTPAPAPAKVKQELLGAETLNRGTVLPASHSAPGDILQSGLKVEIPRDYGFMEASRSLGDWNPALLVKNITVKGGTYAKEGETLEAVLERVTFTVLAVTATVPLPEPHESAEVYLARLKSSLPRGIDAEVDTGARA